MKVEISCNHYRANCDCLVRPGLGRVEGFRWHAKDATLMIEVCDFEFKKCVKFFNCLPIQKTSSYMYNNSTNP